MFQCLITPEGIVADANTASLEAIGSNREDILGKALWDTPWVSETPQILESVRERFAHVAEW